MRAAMFEMGALGVPCPNPTLRRARERGHGTWPRPRVVRTLKNPPLFHRANRHDSDAMPIGGSRAAAPKARATRPVRRAQHPLGLASPQLRKAGTFAPASRRAQLCWVSVPRRPPLPPLALCLPTVAYGNAASEPSSAGPLARSLDSDRRRRIPGAGRLADAGMQERGAAGRRGADSSKGYCTPRTGGTRGSRAAARSAPRGPCKAAVVAAPRVLRRLEQRAGDARRRLSLRGRPEIR